MGFCPEGVGADLSAKGCEAALKQATLIVPDAPDAPACAAGSRQFADKSAPTLNQSRTSEASPGPLPQSPLPHEIRSQSASLVPSCLKSTSKAFLTIVRRSASACRSGRSASDLASEQSLPDHRTPFRQSRHWFFSHHARRHSLRIPAEAA